MLIYVIERGTVVINPIKTVGDIVLHRIDARLIHTTVAVCDVVRIDARVVRIDARVVRIDTRVVRIDTRVIGRHRIVSHTARWSVGQRASRDRDAEQRPDSSHRASHQNRAPQDTPAVPGPGPHRQLTSLRVERGAVTKSTTPVARSAPPPP